MCIKFELETPLPFEVTSGIQNYPVFRITYLPYLIDVGWATRIGIRVGTVHTRSESGSNPS